MRSTETLQDVIEKGRVLERQKETDTNWNKIDEVLESIYEKTQTKSEMETALCMLELVQTAVQSNRSKLSGTGCKVMKKYFEQLGDEMKVHIPSIVPCVFAALSKTNKVVSGRAMSVVHAIGDRCNTKGAVKYIKMHVNSQSRNIREGVLELCIRGIHKDKHREMMNIVEEMVNDAQAEIRSRAREGIHAILEADRAHFAQVWKRLPEKVRQMTGIKTMAKEEKESIEEEREKEQRMQRHDKMGPSVITRMERSPRISIIKTKSTGCSTVVRGPIRSNIVDTIRSAETSKGLKPGHSLEIVGQRLSEHQREVEEVLRKERTPKKTPITNKRQREDANTPSYTAKKEKEEHTEEQQDSKIENVSAEVANLSISHIEEIEHIVEEKDINDSIFTTQSERAPKAFVQICETAIERTSIDTSEYTLLAPEILAKRATTRKSDI